MVSLSEIHIDAVYSLNNNLLIKADTISLSYIPRYIDYILRLRCINSASKSVITCFTDKYHRLYCGYDIFSTDLQYEILTLKFKLTYICTVLYNCFPSCTIFRHYNLNGGGRIHSTLNSNVSVCTFYIERAIGCSTNRQIISTDAYFSKAFGQFAIFEHNIGQFACPT